MDLKKRLEYEIKTFDTDNNGEFEVVRVDNNMNWNVSFYGPGKGFYEGVVCKLNIRISKKYPFEAPTIIFISKMWHPNVNKNGNICLDILQDKWSPIFSIISVLRSIKSLLDDPNADSPFNSDAAKLYKKDIKEYGEFVKKYMSE